MTTCSLHNILTPRGAKVRDARIWGNYIDEALQTWGSRSDSLISSHCWPRFGQSEVTGMLASQRDNYRYLHDQTVRLMNQGETQAEIAERLQQPNELSQQWFNRGYYGTYSHNSKAVYQWYLGWYDGNPANLNPWPPQERGKRYVAAMGGVDVLAFTGDIGETSATVRSLACQGLHLCAQGLGRHALAIGRPAWRHEHVAQRVTQLALGQRGVSLVETGELLRLARQHDRIRALGVTSLSEAPQLPGVPPIAIFRAAAHIEVVSVWSHLACADEPGHPSIDAQKAAQARYDVTQNGFRREERLAAAAQTRNASAM